MPAQVASQLERLAVELESSAHPALDDLTAKVRRMSRPIALAGRHHWWITLPDHTLDGAVHVSDHTGHSYHREPCIWAPTGRALRPQREELARRQIRLPRPVQG